MDLDSPGKSATLLDFGETTAKCQNIHQRRYLNNDIYMTEMTSIYLVTSFSRFHSNRGSGRKETCLVDFFHFCTFRLDVLYFAATFDR